MPVMIATFTVLLLVPVQEPRVQPAPAVSIRQTLATLDFGTASLQKQEPTRERSLGRKVAGGFIGGLGGFVAGAFAGELLRRDCDTCEPAPLPVGAMIGAPIGALVGAMIGAKYF